MPEATDAAQRQRAAFIANAALDKKAERLVALDVRRLTSYADTLIIASGTSDRHARAIADAVSEAVTARGEHPL
ncbi:MAG: RsfS/YbeB/iojap family protein, partial [Myxococcales bacterium]|nr:RsfS/YbeB/iojap family protein [Myxococcales bacterium]